MNNLTIKRLFLIDGMGALLSAFLLGVVLVKFQSVVGMPLQSLYILSILPCFFAVYDFVCYLLNSKKEALLLKGIAFANIAYCFISMAFMFQDYQQLTALGLTYFILEIAVLIILVIIELKVASTPETA